MQWSIRTLLNPVMVRALIYGVNPIDLEYVMQKIEGSPIISGKALEKNWLELWNAKSDHFTSIAKAAEDAGNHVTARELYTLASQCDYASFLINSDNIESKRAIYKRLEASYAGQVRNLDTQVKYIEIPFRDNAKLPTYIHYPDPTKFSAPFPVAVIFAGMGSCKEELNTLSRPLVDRGVAVLAVDQPGTGSALFDYDLKLRAPEIELAFARIMETITADGGLDDSRICSYGLCMGGGYAYRFASKYPSVKCCVNLFPLFIGQISPEKLPRWMKSGKWADFQIGHVANEDDFYQEMSVLEEGQVSCDYYLIHGAHDNWMAPEAAEHMYDKATGFKEKLVIEEPPVFSTGEAITHTMPVGEQMHWIKHVAADWIVAHLS